MKKLALILGAVGAVAVASPAVAASDYYLIIDGVDGEATVAAKVSNWSFGASNPSTMSSGASGRSGQNPLYEAPVGGGTNPLAETTHSVKSPRDAASGQATGRRSGALQAADFRRGGKIDFADAAQADELGALSLGIPAGSDAAKYLCGKTDHLRSGHLIGSDGTVYDLSSLSIACPGSIAGITGGAVAGIVVAGSMKHTKTGHVTLLK